MSVAAAGIAGSPELPDPVAEPAPAPEAAPAPAAPAAPPPDPSAVGRLLDRGLREAERAAVREATKPHEVESDFKIVDGLKGGVRLKEEVFLPDAPTVKNDALRKATTDRLAAEGKSVAWGRVEAEVSLASDWKTDLDGATLGFPGGAKLGYTLLAPDTFKEDGRARPLDTAKEVLKAQTVDLPVTAGNARDLPPGAEFKLRGEMRAGVTGAEGGLSATASTARTATIEVRRLEGEKVAVTVTRERASAAGAGAGTTLDGGTALSATVGATGSSGEVEKFTLDLSKGQAQAAYDALVRGDTRAARAVAAAGGGAVTADGGVEEWSGRKLAAGLATKLANGFGVGLSIYDEKISERDPRVAGSPWRQRLAVPEWRGTGGALEASFGSETAIGAATVGFSTKGVLEYQAVAPGRLGPAELPLDATKARGLAEGSEVTIHGAGSIALSAGGGVGASAGTGGVSVGYGVGAKVEVKGSEDLAVNVKKLSGDTVRVIVADRGAKSAGLTISAEAGVKIDRGAIPGGSALAGIAGDKLAGEAQGAVAKELSKILSARASAGVSAETSSREVAAFDLDLSTETGRAAYDRLLRLDARDASRLAGVAGSGVSRVASLDEEISSRRTSAEVSILGQTIIESKGERRDRLARLVNGAGATTTISEHEFTRSRRGLLTRGDVEWEAVQVKDLQSGAAERFLHLKLGKLEDQWTSYDEGVRAERFAGLMGAKVTERSVKNADPNWWDRNVNPATYGKTTATADVYFTEAAMNKVAGATNEQALLAFGRATAKLEGDAAKLPGWASENPAVRRAAREMVEDFDPFDQTSDRGGNQAAEAHYRRFTGGRDLRTDHATWQAAQDFGKFVDRARTGGETERLKAFADLGARRGFDFHATIGAMNDLAGADVVLLNRFEVSGKDFKLATASEGALTHPDTAISEAFDPK